MINNKENIATYREGMLKEKKYRTKKQYKLKMRVFDTLNDLLILFGLDGLKKNKKLIDLGAGDFSFVKVCNEKGLNAEGIDINNNINFETDKIPKKTKYFDIVTALSVIEHLYSPAIFLKEIIRILKPKGALILVLPNWNYTIKTFYNNPTHVHPYNPDSIYRLLVSYDFDKVYVMPWLVKKPLWMWKLPFAFFFANKIIPFSGGAPSFIPKFLKGSSSSMLVLAIKKEIN